MYDKNSGFKEIVSLTGLNKKIKMVWFYGDQGHFQQLKLI